MEAIIDFHQKDSHLVMSTLGKAGVAVSVAVALVIGIWINRVAWQHRKLMWQLQGVLIGGAAGYVVGRLQK